MLTRKLMMYIKHVVEITKNKDRLQCAPLTIFYKTSCPVSQ